MLRALTAILLSSMRDLYYNNEFGSLSPWNIYLFVSEIIGEKMRLSIRRQKLLARQ
jgi:hypothetical protein